MDWAKTTTRRDEKCLSFGYGASWIRGLTAYWIHIILNTVVIQCVWIPFYCIHGWSVIIASNIPVKVGVYRRLDRVPLRCRHNGCDSVSNHHLASVYSDVWLGAHQRKHQSSASLAFVRGIHRRPVNSPHKWPATRKMLPFDDVIMQ